MILSKLLISLVKECKEPISAEDIESLPVFYKDGDIYQPIRKAEVRKIGYDVSQAIIIALE